MTLTTGAILLLTAGVLATAAGLLGTYRQVQQLRAAVFFDVGDAFARGKIPDALVIDGATQYVVLGVDGADRELAQSLVQLISEQSTLERDAEFVVVADGEFDVSSTVTVHREDSVRQSMRCPWVPYLIFADESGQIHELATAGSSKALLSKLDRYFTSTDQSEATRDRHFA